MKTTLSFNIGLNVGSTLTHCEADIHRALGFAFPNCEIIRSYIRRSGIGELTCCTTIRCPELVAHTRHVCIYDLAVALDQDAIACKEGRTNLLIGPKAADWNNGEFCEDHWLPVLPENRPNPDGQAVASVLGTTRREIDGWTIELHRLHDGKLGGWFERNSNGDGGGLWMALDNGPGNTLQLVDYDGVCSLPAAVLTFLRQAGVDADSSFE